MAWDPAKHPRGTDGRFGNTVGGLHLKKHNVRGSDIIAVISKRVKKYAGFKTVAEYIEAHPKGKATALRELAADHKAGRIALGTSKSATAGLSAGPVEVSGVTAEHRIEVLSKTTRKYAGHDTVGSFAASHPKGKEAALRTIAADQKAGRIALRAPAKVAAGTTSDPIDASKWKKVGTQKGSNPGGVYEAPDGRQFYLKEGKSKAHVESELLANALYKKLGVKTLEPKAFKLGGKLAVGSEIQAISKFDSNLNAHIDLAQKDFAAHAYLANWDAVGLHFDNLGVVDGKVAQLDAGGALKFRARGNAKPKFDGEVTEFDTLRSGVHNHQAEKVFGAMTAAELEASAKPVLKLTDKEIDDVLGATVTDPAERASLAKILRARRNDLGQRVKAAKAKEEADKAATGKLHPDDSARWAKAAGVGKWIGRHPNTEEAGLLRKALGDSGVSFTPNSKSDAVALYTGSGYDSINSTLRKGEPTSASLKSSIDELDKLIATSKFKQDTICYRGFGWNAKMQNKAPPPSEHSDKGFVSVSLNPSVARVFSDASAKTIYRVRVPKGFPGRAVSNKGSTTEGMINGEAEIILPRNTLFRIVKRTKAGAFGGQLDVVDVVALLPKTKI